MVSAIHASVPYVKDKIAFMVNGFDFFFPEAPFCSGTTEARCSKRFTPSGSPVISSAIFLCRHSLFIVRIKVRKLVSHPASPVVSIMMLLMPDSASSRLTIVAGAGNWLPIFQTPDITAFRLFGDGWLKSILLCACMLPKTIALILQKKSFTAP